MNAAKMTLVSTVVAAAFGLALSFGASPAKAHCKGKHLDGDGMCIHVDEGQRSQTFEVELFDGSLFTGDCIGSSERKQVTDAKFPPSTVAGCGGLTLEGASEFFHLCQLNINRPRRLDMNVTFFFTTGVGVEGGALCPNDVYQGEFLAEFEDPEACEAGNPCVVIIDGSNLDLEKLQQPNKGLSAGLLDFSVGTIVWTPVPE